jgi:uncharacterized damage-inducible protein DinB
MALAILHVYHHNNWANATLVEFLESQPAELLTATEPGAYGTIGETLTHLAAAQERYVGRLGSAASPTSLHETGGWPGFGRLRESLGWSGPLLLTAAASTPDDASLSTEYHGESVTLKLATVLAQAINHATEHRVNITTILAARGIEHPELDAWAFPDEEWP